MTKEKRPRPGFGQRRHAYLARLLATLIAWGAAYGLVMGLFTILGSGFRSQPLALQVLVMTGVLVLAMANVVMPAVTRVVARALAREASEPPRS